MVFSSWCFGISCRIIDSLHPASLCRWAMRVLLRAVTCSWSLVLGPVAADATLLRAWPSHSYAVDLSDERSSSATGALSGLSNSLSLNIWRNCEAHWISAMSDNRYYVKHDLVPAKQASGTLLLTK